MKIGYPAAGIYGDHRFCLSRSFTESGLMGVFDTQTGSVDVISRSSLKSSLMDTLQSLQIEVIITPELQIMALKVFRENGLNVYKASSNMLSKNIELLKNRSLITYSTNELFTEKKGCSSSVCSSCSSTICR